MPAHPLRVAIGQIRMEWTGAKNTRSMLEAMSQAASANAKLCVFPELAVTGFHRQIRAEAKSNLVYEHLSKIKQACARLSMAVVTGAPTFRVEGHIFNSCIFIDERGEQVGVVDKIGLTPAEETFFARGSARTAVELLGLRATAILCREIDDLEELEAALPQLSPQIIFWPGIMRPAVDGSPSTHVQRAQRLALHAEAFVIQSNWPNSLNYPEESAEAGHSMVIDPSGEVLFRLPMAMPGVGVFELGQTTFEWQTQLELASGATGL